MNYSILVLSKISLTLVALFTCTLSQAELVWEQKEQEVAASPLDKEIVARYPFRNAGTTAVKFKAVKTGCSCMSAEVDNAVVPPGGKGVVTVKFTPEFRIGTQKRPIAIQLDDDGQNRLALYLTVKIPEIIRPEPIFLKWAAEEAIAPKAVTIVTDEKYPVESLRVLPSVPPVETKITRIENSGNYSVEVLPTRSAAPQGYYLNVEAKLSDGRAKRTTVYVVVR